MLLFAQQSTPRLQHMANWLGNYLFGKPLGIVTTLPTDSTAIVLNYSTEKLPLSYFQIAPHTLLFEQVIQAQTIDIKNENGTTYFFKTNGDFHFDVLAASFYLLQRYEEYFPHEKDMYGRYAHTNSLAYTQGFLHLPIVDMWMQQLKNCLLEKFPQLQFAERTFYYQPTYDVDVAYSYKGKGLLRNVWGLYRSLTNLHTGDFLQRIDFFFRGKKDPFDVYEQLDELHKQYNLQPIYFFLLAQQQKEIDKNIHPSKKVYRQLIKRLANKYKTGIHLSGAASASFKKMVEEKAMLASIIGEQTPRNRMHYLLFQLPKTYRELQEESLSITEEYSMGYGTINGFRASTCTPYFWYDVEAEKSTMLQIFPFCYMEANSIFEQHDSPAAALEEMNAFLQVTRQVQGRFISIFHNHLISQLEDGKKWMNIYQQFLSFLNE